MGKYFLGSVGKAEAFKINDNEKRLMFVSNTLTDSAVNVSISGDEIRGGTGAPVQAVFYHDATVEINLTDVFWKKEYLAAQLGANFDEAPQAYQNERIACETAGELTLGKDIVGLPAACGEAAKIAWYKEESEDDDAWKVAELKQSAAKVIEGGFKADKVYCVRYLANDEAARVATIHANFVPAEFFLLITCPLYAGDSCDASDGKPAGTITFEVKRFRLNGGLDLAMAMSSNVTMSLAGKALASNAGCDLNAQGGSLLTLREVIFGRNLATDGELMILNDPSLAKGELEKDAKIMVAMAYKDGSAIEINNAIIKLNDDVLTGGILTNKPTAGAKITAEFEDLEAEITVIA